MRTETLTYRLTGTSCVADLHLPDTLGEHPIPGVVAVESGAKVKEMLTPIAEVLTAAGFAVLAPDYRGFGASGGEPRGLLSPQAQVQDVRRAVGVLAERPEVDAQRIGAWGNSVAGPVVVQAGVLDRRIRAVVAQSPSMFDGWRAATAQTGTAGFAALRERLAADQQRCERGEPGERLPWLSFGAHGDDTSQAFADLGQRYPSFRNEIALESWEHLLTWAPTHWIPRLTPTPLLIVTNAGPDPYHDLDEAQHAYAAAMEPKRLVLLPYDAMGLYIDPGRAEALTAATAWFDEHLLRAPLPRRTSPQDAAVAG